MQYRTTMEHLKGKTLILADDDQFNIYALTAALEDYGFNIITASNGKEALNRLEDSGQVDIVLMDIMMPEMDGYEAMRRIRASGKNDGLPIIALTARAMKGDIDNCMEAGATGYLSKPVDVEKLVAMMASLLAPKE